jgi:cytochrome P450 family 135
VSQPAGEIATPRSGLPPGPGLAPVHQTVAWIRRPLPFLEDCRQLYGDTFTMRLSGAPPMVMLSDPAAVREVFTGDPDVLRSGAANALLQAALGRNSLLVLDGDEHLRERRLLLPPFHGKRMRRYGELIQGVAEREVAGWPTGAPVRLAPSMRAIALEVIVRAVFGVDDPGRVASFSRALSRLLDTVTKPYRVLALLLLKPGGRTMRAWQRHAPTIRRVDALIFDEIERRRREADLAGRDDILSLLLQARDEQGAPLTGQHLRDELMTMLVAGHETTATALAWALERLMRRPGALARLAEEAEAGDDTYLDAVVKETLRVRPVIPFVVRELTAPLELAGWALPAGARVAPCVHLVHRRPDLYPDPDAFRPERFLERPEGAYTWIPFGGGTRRCIGAAFATFEAKTVLRVIARSGRLRPVDTADEAVGRRGLTLTPAGEAKAVWEPLARVRSYAGTLSSELQR